MKKLSYIAAALLLASVSMAHAESASDSSTPSNDPQATSANSDSPDPKQGAEKETQSVDRAERPDVAERPEVAEKPETPESSSSSAHEK